MAETTASRLIRLLAFLRILRRRCPATWQRGNVASREHWQCARPVHARGGHSGSLRHGRWIFLRLYPDTPADVGFFLRVLLLVAAAASPVLFLVLTVGGGR